MTASMITHDPDSDPETPRPSGPAQFAGDLWGTHFDALSALILFFALTIIALSVAEVLFRSNLPSDGWSSQPSFFGPEQRFVFDENLTGVPSPLYSGDVLLAVEGEPVEEILRRALTFNPKPPANWSLGQRVHYTVLRDGRTPTVEVLLGERPAWLVLRTIASTLFTDPSVFPSLLIGLFVFMQRPRSRASRLLLLLTTCFFASDGIGHPRGGLSMGVTDFFYVGSYWPAEFYGTLIWSLVIAPIYLHLFLVFPVPKLPLRQFPRLTLAILYFSTPLALLCAYVVTRGQPSAFWSAWSGVSELEYFVVLGAVVLAMLHTLATTRDPVHQSQIRWVASGTLITSVGAILGGVMATLGVLSQYPLLSLVAFRLPFVAFPASVAVAIHRYQLFDIDVIINRTLVYLPLTAMLAGLYAAGITLSQKLFVAATGQESDAAAVITTLVVVAAFTPLKDRLQSMVDKRFKEAPDATKRLLEFGEQVRSRVTAVEPRQVCRRFLEEAVAALAAKAGAAYLRRGADLQLVHAIGELQGEPVIRALLETRGKEFGVVYLGETGRGRDYSAREKQALQQVASIVALAIEQDAVPKLARQAHGPVDQPAQTE